MKTRKELNVIYYNYVISCIPDTDTLQTEYGIYADNDRDKLLYVLFNFDKQANFEFNKKRIPNLQQRFADWLQGLPGVFEVEFMNFEIIRLCKFWELIPENATEKQEDKYLKNWFIFWASQFLKACNKNKIETNYLF